MDCLCNFCGRVAVFTGIEYKGYTLAFCSFRCAINLGRSFQAAGVADANDFPTLGDTRVE